ncbi:chaperonin 10-like protein [Suillus subluteus]|nr:chaperonin 10-like protein [Suillus subluteus]
MSSQTHLAFASTAVPTPSPGPGEVMVKVAFSAVIPLDIYMADYGQMINSEYPVVLGFNVSGVVEAVGSGVDGLQMGDKVCALTMAGSKGKGLQERAIIQSCTCAKLPDDYSLEAAATIPDNFMTAFTRCSIVWDLLCPQTPILVYGAGATSGQYAIQLLALAGYKRVIATASPRHHPYLKSLGATHSTLKSISSVVSSDGVVAMLLPVTAGSKYTAGKDEQMWMELLADMNPFPDLVKIVCVKAILYQQNEYLRDNLMLKILPQLLEEVEALNVVRNGQVNGEKVVVKVASM